VNLKIVQNEINKEKLLPPNLPFEYSEYLTPDKITPEVLKEASNYLEKVKKYYIDYYNKFSNAKEMLIGKYQSADKDGFNKLRDDYTNKELEKFLKDESEMTKTIIFKNEIIQKMEPIYMAPKSKLIKAHFYAPTKSLFGLQVDTFVINVFVLWIMTIFLYFALYFRLLKKLLDSGGSVIGKTKKGSD
jgi:ABC transport system ATP-binding/permease protein